MLPKEIYCASSGHHVIAEDRGVRMYTVRDVARMHNNQPHPNGWGRVLCECKSERTAVAICISLSAAAGMWELVDHVRSEGGSSVITHASED